MELLKIACSVMSRHDQTVEDPVEHMFGHVAI